MLFPYHDDNPTERFPWLTILLIVINVYIHLRISVLPERVQEARYFEYGFVPVRLTQLFTGRPVVVDARYLPEAIREQYEVVRRRPRVLPFFIAADDAASEAILPPAPAPVVLRSLVTSMFLHGSWLHLIGNMWFFWLFGNNVEDRLGWLRFILFYLLGGLCASLLHYVAYPTSPITTIGASGAISAVMGAYVVTWPHARVRCLAVIPPFFLTNLAMPAAVFIAIWFIGQIFGLLGSGGGEAGGVAWWAHIGGFLMGILLMLLMNGSEPKGSTGDYEGELIEA